MKDRLDSFEIIQLHNGDDLVQIGKSKFSGHYIFIFNTKPLFAYKTFRVFGEKLKEYVEKYRLTEVKEE